MRFIKNADFNAENDRYIDNIDNLRRKKMAKYTSQMARWMGFFGKDYTKRNSQSLEELEQLYQKEFGITRTEMNLQIIGDLDHSIRILEVGANRGNQLLCLQKTGFKDLYGIELQEGAVELCKQRTEKINIIQGSAFDIPFKDNFFDLVYTSGVLEHIAPHDIEDAIHEIYRCSKRYIWGFEPFAETYQEINYRGNKELQWKTDFAQLYLDTFDGLRLVKEQKLKFKKDDNVNTLFLLEK